MRTLFEIIEAAKSGERPEYEELRFALIALDAASILSRRALRNDKHRELHKESAHKTMKNALNSDPKEYIGWNNDPDNPDCQKRRKTAIGILDKVMKKMEK